MKTNKRCQELSTCWGGILRYKKIDQVHLVEQFKEVRENPVVGVLLSNGYWFKGRQLLKYRRRFNLDNWLSSLYKTNRHATLYNKRIHRNANYFKFNVKARWSMQTCFYYVLLIVIVILIIINNNIDTDVKNRMLFNKTRQCNCTHF